MRIRYYVLALALVGALGVGGLLFLMPAPDYKPDLTQINNVAETLARDFDRFESDGYRLPASSYDYVVLDTEGKVVQATREGLAEDVFTALKRGDLVVDIVQGGRLLGKVIFASNMEAQWQAYRSSVQLFVVFLLVAMLAVSGVFLFVMHVQILRPFKEMKAFAARVAAGELDAPLAMDRRNAFGAFTESFDLMRVELKRARANEQAAEKSKRELVASLSHDIQTPLSSIKAVAEVMELGADESEAQKLKTIQSKASQIQTLVTNLFHTTLEELDSLSVQLMGIPSIQITEMIKTADYRGKVCHGDGEFDTLEVCQIPRPRDTLPGCLVLADPVRLAQVMDNVIANSYKYADTVIWVSGSLHEGGLVISLRDEGPGVAEEELPLLCSKYYRGSSSKAKDGYGLGLFIAHHLIERMGGRLECLNASPGFEARIWLKLDE